MLASPPDVAPLATHELAEPRAAGSNLGYSVISANSAALHDNFDVLWSEAFREKVEKHLRIAREAPKGPEGASKRRWHAGRGLALARPVRRHLERCGFGSIELRCGCPAPTARPRRCGRRIFCPTCGDARAKKTWGRVRHSVQVHLDEQRAVWRERLDAWAKSGGGRDRRPREPTVYMITLTVPHRDEEGAAERVLDDSWRMVSRGRVAGHWTAPSLAVWEWTPGRDGRGHPHLHVIVVAPWVDYAKVWGEWRECVLAAGGGWCESVKITTPKSRQWAAASAARYVSKYVTSADKLSLSVEDWVRLAKHTHGRRTLRASVGNKKKGIPGFWRDDDWEACCETCEEPFRLNTPLLSAAAKWEHRKARAAYQDFMRGARPPPEIIRGL